MEPSQQARVRAIGFDAILPMRGKDDSILRRRTRSTKHFQGMKVIQLFEFTFLPDGPCVECLDLASCKATESIFSRCDVLRLKSMNRQIDFVSGQGESAVRAVIV